MVTISLCTGTACMPTPCGLCTRVRTLAPHLPALTYPHTPTLQEYASPFTPTSCAPSPAGSISSSSSSSAQQQPPRVSSSAHTSTSGRTPLYQCRAAAVAPSPSPEVVRGLTTDAPTVSLRWLRLLAAGSCVPVRAHPSMCWASNSGPCLDMASHTCYTPPLHVCPPAGNVSDGRTPPHTHGTPACALSWPAQDVEYDAVIIGSGMGGLSTAAQLAAKGARTVVLEK